MEKILLETYQNGILFYVITGYFSAHRKSRPTNDQCIKPISFNCMYLDQLHHLFLSFILRTTDFPGFLRRRVNTFSITGKKPRTKKSGRMKPKWVRYTDLQTFFLGLYVMYILL